MFIIIGVHISFEHKKIAKGAKHNRKEIKILKLFQELFQTLLTFQMIDQEKIHSLKEMNH